MAVARIEQVAELLVKEWVGSFRDVDLSGLATANYTPPDYALESLLPRGYVTLLGGHGGTGKSTLALTWAAHSAVGRAWNGLQMPRVPCVYVSLEDAPDLVRLRLRNICKGYGLPYSDVAEMLTILDGTESGPALYAAATRDADLGPTPAWQELQDRCGRAGLVIIDNASEAFAGNENDRLQVRSFMRCLGLLARESGAAVLLLAHIDKAAARQGSYGNSYSGSTAWHNSARSRLALVDNDGAPELRQEKLNLARALDPVSLSFNETGVLIPVTGATRTQMADDDSRFVLEAITRITSSGDWVAAATAGPRTTYHSVEAFLPDQLLGRDGKRRVNAAVQRLQVSGRITRVTFSRSNRHKGHKWELTQSDPLPVTY